MYYFIWTKHTPMQFTPQISSTCHIILKTNTLSSEYSSTQPSIPHATHVTGYLSKTSTAQYTESRKSCRWPSWQFRALLAKYVFHWQRIYVSANKFVDQPHTNTHTHSPTWTAYACVCVCATCLWLAQLDSDGSKNNENVFHFDWQFPQFLVAAVVAAVAAAAPPCLQLPQIIEIDCSNMSHAQLQRGGEAVIRPGSHFMAKFLATSSRAALIAQRVQQVCVCVPLWALVCVCGCCSVW